MVAKPRSGTPARPNDQSAGIDVLGPSDTSDTGSDAQHERTMATGADNPGEWGALPVDTANDSDAAGTGERGPATGRPFRDGADISPETLPMHDEDLLNLEADDVDEEQPPD